MRLSVIPLLLATSAAAFALLILYLQLFMKIKKPLSL